MTNLQTRQDTARLEALTAAVALEPYHPAPEGDGTVDGDRRVAPQSGLVARAQAFYEFLMSSAPVPNEFEPPVVYKDDAGEWRWYQRSANHETIADSGEGHPGADGKAHCIDMARRQTGHTPKVEHEPIAIDLSDESVARAQQVVHRVAVAAEGAAVTFLQHGDTFVVGLDDEKFDLQPTPVDVPEPGEGKSWIDSAVAAVEERVKQAIDAHRERGGEQPPRVRVGIWPSLSPKIVNVAVVCY